VDFGLEEEGGLELRVGLVRAALGGFGGRLMSLFPATLYCSFRLRQKAGRLGNGCQRWAGARSAGALTVRTLVPDHALEGGPGPPLGATGRPPQPAVGHVEVVQPLPADQQAAQPRAIVVGSQQRPGHLDRQVPVRALLAEQGDEFVRPPDRVAAGVPEPAPVRPVGHAGFRHEELATRVDAHDDAPPLEAAAPAPDRALIRRPVTRGSTATGQLTQRERSSHLLAAQLAGQDQDQLLDGGIQVAMGAMPPVAAESGLEKPDRWRQAEAANQLELVASRRPRLAGDTPLDRPGRSDELRLEFPSARLQRPPCTPGLGERRGGSSLCGDDSGGITLGLASRRGNRVLFTRRQ